MGVFQTLQVSSTLTARTIQKIAFWAVFCMVHNGMLLFGRFGGAGGVGGFFDGFGGFGFGFEDFFGGDFDGSFVESVDGVAIEIFASETGGFAGAFAEVTEIVAADFATAHDLDFFDEGAVHEERFFDTYTGGDFAHSDAGGVGIFANSADDSAFEDLDAEFFAFFDFLGNPNGVTGADIDDGFFLLGASDHLE